MDGDLGNPSDDYVGCDSANNVFYTYNGDAFDDSFSNYVGYGSNPPAVGAKLLSDNMDNHIAYNIGSANNGDPSTDDHWLKYLTAKWKNGQPTLLGGNGYNSPATTAVRNRYMYHGNPYLNTGWTEGNPGSGETLSLIHI